MTKFDLGIKMGQGHNLNNLVYTVHTKFQGHWSIGSEEEDLLRFLPYMGIRGHLGHVTQLICVNFHSHSPLGF